MSLKKRFTSGNPRACRRVVARSPSMMTYTAKVLHQASGCSPVWNAAQWADAQTAQVSNFRPESSASWRPVTTARLAASSEGLHGIFHVGGELVWCVRTHYFDDVWKDSCVEFFVQPKPDGGYFNFEFNCGGAFLCSYITDSTRTPSGGLAALQRIPEHEGRAVQVASTLPRSIDPEAEKPCDWTLSFFIPFAIFSPLVGPVRVLPGDAWRCNFYKCAEEVSHPHWAAWSPVDELNFHLPRCFGDLKFK